MMVKVIGAGLAGTEAAWQLAQRGISVELYEMKPHKKSPAHHTDTFAELVCSNSLRGDKIENAVGLLKEELRRLDSLIITCADATRVEAGGCLAVDREGFAAMVTEKIRSHPNIAVVANIGSSHLEYLGTRENITRAKLEVAMGLPAGGTLLINGDEPLLAHLGQDFSEDRPLIPEGIRVLRVSLAGAENADYQANHITSRDGGMVFDLTTPEGVWRDLYIPAVGQHFIWAASFAAAVGQLSGLHEGQVREGLASYRPAAMRQDIRKLGGITLMVDCYNAAPESMKAALSALSLMAGNRRRVAVLGDMKELGTDTVALHRGVGAYAAKSGLDLLITVGELGAEIATGAMEAGMNPDSVRVTGGKDTYEGTADYLRSILREGDHVLFKASRSMALETVVEALANH